MSKFEVTVKFYFKPHCVSSYKYEDNYKSIKKSFSKTKFNFGQHLASYSPSWFSNDLGSFVFEPLNETAKWISEDTLYFVIQTYSGRTREEDIIDDLLDTSLEDSMYEGEDNGWVVMTSDGKYEYGLVDYRGENNITVKKIIPKYLITLQLYFNPKNTDTEVSTSFDLTSYLQTLDLQEFVDSLSMYSGLINKESARLLPDNKVVFEVESDEPIEGIYIDLKSMSLEDCAYEGSSGWVVMNEDKTQEIGLIDYRKPENVSIRKI